MRAGKEPEVVHTAILMATYNGAQFLPEQLRSLAALDGGRVSVHASDDGSTDGTLALLAEWRAGWTRGDFEILAGPRKGFAENFRAMIVNDAIRADLYAYSDQDDIWDADKLVRATAWLQSGDMSRPRVFCSRTRIVDRQGRPAGLSSLFRRPPSFRNAITQSIAGGNTMVFNQAARDLLAEASRRTGFVTHDWWTYLIVSGSGGEVHYATEPSISYRQHSGNLVGENNSLSARLTRIRWLLRGRFRDYGARNVASLKLCRDLLDADAQWVLSEYEGARGPGMLRRLWHLWRSGARRQTAASQVAMIVAAVFRLL